MDRNADDTLREGPRVSVVIPTYGRNEYLPDAIETVIDQTYENIELIVVDDGSPTPVRDTLDGFSFDRLNSVTFVRHYENRGANTARNNGIRVSSGKYIAFLDDDDFWDETKISQQVKAFVESGPNVGVVHSGIKTLDSSGENIEISTAEGDVMKNLLTGENFGQFSSVMVRSSVIDDAGLPDEKFPAWQDREWFFRLAQHCHFKAVPKVLTFRRIGLPTSIGKNFVEIRDVAYPLFVEKHYPLAKEYGIYYARSFIASLRTTLGKLALNVNRYKEARRFFVLAFLANPLYRPAHPQLLASLGGKWTYIPASKIRRDVQSIYKKPGDGLV